MRYLLFLLFIVSSLHVTAQQSQVLRGQVLDKDSRMRLPGISVVVHDGHETKGISTDEQGRFEISNISLGKHNITFSALGYTTQIIPNVLFTSGRETVLQIELEESARNLNEVMVSATRKHEVINEMALVSVKTFDVQEAERYAGSRADPARMASNYAGVQGADDSRNDIVIRGNSPQGLLWRLEGVDIPSPNHFSVPGTTGGPVSMLNNKTLGNSDFFTGAFPAPYGNAVGGVFDVNFRNGNTSRHEISFQLGFLGTELTAEGPLSKKGASYLISYRYSTLKLFEGMNIKIGTSSVPNYQDGMFKIHVPLTKKSNLNLFGLGGLSNIDLIVSKLEAEPKELYGESDRDQYFTSNTGIIGASFESTLSSKTYFKSTLAQTGNEIYATHYKVFRNQNFKVDSLKYILGYNFITNSTVWHNQITHKFSRQWTFNGGIVLNRFVINNIDSSRQYPPTRQDWQHRTNYKGAALLWQPYMQMKWKANEYFTAVLGLHAQGLSINNSFALEPRLGLRYQTGNTSSLSFGYGLHSQMQPLYQLYAHLPQNASYEFHNLHLNFTRSHHFVVGYEQRAGKNWRIRSEVYYQYLFNVPIETHAWSSFSSINQGSNFSRLFPDTLVNKGTGRNVGIELTVMRSFFKGYFVMFTGSVFDSKAKGADGILRNTDYNSRFAVNALGGYEKAVGKRGTIITGLKITYAGGRLYSPANDAATRATGELVIVDSLRNSKQFPNYFRADVKLAYRYNAHKLMHEVGIDLVNVFNTKNVLSNYYNPDLATMNIDPYVKQYQLGFLPLFYYRIDFGFNKKKP